MLRRVIVFPVMIICFIFLSGAKPIEEFYNVNGVKASKGDIITYEYYMSEVKEPIEAAGAYLIYSNDSLEYIDGSICFDVLDNAMINTLEDSIYYCDINVTDGFDFENEGLVVRASFKVINTDVKDASIVNAFDEIFTFENEDVDLTPNDYKFREVIRVNDEIINSSAKSGIDAHDVSYTDANTVEESKNYLNVSIPIIIILFIVLIIFVFKKKK